MTTTEILTDDDFLLDLEIEPIESDETFLAGLKKIALMAIDEVENDRDLCRSYERICAYATDDQWRQDVAGQIAYTMLENELSDVFAAMDVIELQLGTED